MLDGESWNENGFTWEQSVYRFRAAGYSVDYFIDFSISVDVKNSTKRVIDVSKFSNCIDFVYHAIEWSKSIAEISGAR